MYVKFWKRFIDIVLSGIALIILCIPMLIIAIIIKVQDPGPAIFKQKRVGIHKKSFNLYKFRSMKVDTPDVPTHLLEHPEQYITKIGAFIRRTSIDELPQLWNIFTGKMTIIGPRPCLWTQEDLLAERDKYGANDVKPGLTGWAQINGRDELEIPVKAKLDGEYVQKMSFRFDLRCLFGSVFKVLRAEGVVEGGTGKLSEQKKEQGISDEIQEELVEENQAGMKRILITGAGSYIGESFKKYMAQWEDKYQVDSISMRGEAWKNVDFSAYDAVFHVAGIAHADVGSVTEEQKKLYYEVNTDLAVETAEKAKASGVKQFIFMSSMIVYSGCKETMITADTEPKPENFYGDSKWQADQKIRELSDDNFKVVMLRPPMIYGKGSKGNYPELAKLATRLPAFPKVKNKRSMLYIENLCQFVKLMIDNEESGIFFPQNSEYTNTSEMVKMIAEAKNHRIRMVPGMSGPVHLVMHMPGKLGGMATKAFGDSAYEMSMSEYKEDYRVCDLEESVERTESSSYVDVVDKGGQFEVKNQDNLVSIIMPAFNAEEYIAESIQSVLNQSYQNWELQIIDDSSTDSTGEIAKSFSQQDQRIHYYCMDKNSGAAVARKTGIEKAQGRFLAFLDSDDLWLPEKLAKQISYMMDNSYSFTCTQYGKVDQTGKVLDALIDDSQIKTYKDMLKWCPGNSTVIYDAGELGKIYPIDIKKRNDYVLWLDVIQKSGSLHCFQEKLGYHRLVENSISSKKLKLIRYHWNIYRKKEKINFFYSSYLIVFWCFKGVLRYLPGKR